METAEELKVLLVGDTYVGKTCFLFRFCDNKFPKNFMSTIGVDFKTKNFYCDGKPTKASQ